MLVYFDTDVYSHLEAAGRDHSQVSVDDREFLASCAASNRISVYFSVVNLEELGRMLAWDIPRTQLITQVARRLCPVRRLCKNTQKIIADDINYWLRHQRCRRVDVRLRPSGEDRRRLANDDWISLLTEQTQQELSSRDPQFAEILKESRKNRLFDMLREYQANTRGNLDFHDFRRLVFVGERELVVKFIWGHSGLKGLEELETNCPDLPIEEMQSFRVFVEYMAILMYTCAMGSPSGTDPQKRKVEPGDGADMEHAIFSGFADVFVSDDRKARDRYLYLSDPLPRDQPKPMCIDLPGFVQMLRCQMPGASHRVCC